MITEVPISLRKFFDNLLIQENLMVMAHMHRAVAVIAVGFFGFCFFPVWAAATTIASVIPRLMEAQTFERIGEFFHGREVQGHRFIVRTQGEDRGGMYFVVILREPVRHLPEGSELKVAFVVANDPETKSFVFKLDPPRFVGKEIFVGITGSDWPDPEAPIMAWEILLRDPSGGTLARKQSYLWSWSDQ